MISSLPPVEPTGENRDVFNFLVARPIWEELPESFLIALAEQLQLLNTAREFTILCESTGILDNNILSILDGYIDDTAFVLSAIATTLTSYANTLAGEQRFSEAVYPLDLAILMKPRHLPAWISRAIVAINVGDYGAAVEWASRVIEFQPDPKSEDSWESGIAKFLTADGEKQAAEALDEPEMVGAWRQVLLQMQAIKETCQ